MAKKDKQDQQSEEEATPTLQDMEAHIENMLKPDPNEDRVSIAVTMHDETADVPQDIPTAPELPTQTPAEQKKQIKVLDADETDESKEPPASVDEPADEPVPDPAPEEPEAASTEDTSADVDANMQPEAEPEVDHADEAEATQDPLPDLVDDEQTAQAVADIVAKESDEVLAAEDEKIAAAFAPPKQKSEGNKLARFLTGWWRNRRARAVVLGSVFVLLIAAALTPTSRYLVLNTVGVRVSTSVRVLDESTLLPLKNVEVSVGETRVKTDENGAAKLDQLKLGPAEIKIHKRAFAPESRRATLGWGSNQSGDFKLRPTGTQYSFDVHDFLSTKPINKAEATSDDANAFSDADGKILLTMDEPADEFKVMIRYEGYRQEELTVNADSVDVMKVDLAPARPHVFISERSGKYDVYRVDADGKNEQLVLKGTGNERQDMTLAVHPTKDTVALVSTRSGERTKSGFMLSSLTLINLKDKSTKAVAQSEKIQLVDWAQDRLVYVQIAEGASAVHPRRHRLMSYDTRNGQVIEIAASNYFNDVMMVQGKVYYAPSGLYQNGVDVSLFAINPDGTNRQVVLDKETWNLFRTSYGGISIAVPGAWYEYDLSRQSLKTLDGEPADTTNRIYVDSPTTKKSLWIDMRDGKGALMAYDQESGNETALETKSGLAPPLVWLNDKTAVFRVRTNQETTDYAVSLDGGESKKIRDVTNTSGVDSWYYY